jgi:hypothetical protein
VYAVRGWVRRVIKDEADGEWHIEITPGRPGTVRDNCLVVESPPPAGGHQYQVARDQCDALVSAAGAPVSGSHGDVTPVARMKFVGPAFFDAEIAVRVAGRTASVRLAGVRSLLELPNSGGDVDPGETAAKNVTCGLNHRIRLRRFATESRGPHPLTAPKRFADGPFVPDIRLVQRD